MYDYRKQVIGPSTGATPNLGATTIIPVVFHGSRMITPLEHLKTDSMKLVEMEQGRTIEDVLAIGSLSQIAKRIGRDQSTVSKWKGKFGLRGQQVVEQEEHTGQLEQEVSTTG